jgi:uncharacterized membrane protein
MTNYITYPSPATLNFTNGTLSPVLDYGNTITGGSMGIIILFAVFFASFMTFTATPYKDKALVGASFMTFAVSFLMFGAGLLNPFYFFGCLILLALSVYLSSRWHAE